MTDAMLYALLCLGLVAAFICPLGRYMARVYGGERTLLDPVLRPVEHGIYALCGINPKQESTAWAYATAVLLLGVFGLAALFLIFTFQDALPLNPGRLPGLPCDLAFNAAAAFLTNTDWQSYSGETTLSPFAQMFACTVQNFLSAATGMAVAAALFRALARKQSETIGNPYADVVRGMLYILLPLSLLLAVILSSQGVVQNLSSAVIYTPLEGGGELKMTQGPVASQAAIKLLGSNGGGYFNANSAHPFENPTPLSHLLQIVAMLLIPASLTHTFGVMVGDRRQGWMLLAAMTVLFLPMAGLVLAGELSPSPYLDAGRIDAGAGNMEGKETRFGAGASALFASVTAATAAGAVSAMHASFMPLSGLSLMLFMQLGEIVYGGVGSGIYGMLMFVILTVFIGGLMVGRTPEFLCRKLGSYDVKMASLVMLVPTALVLLGTALLVSTEAGRAGAYNPGAHGFSEILYAASSAANSNGSAFAGLQAASPFYNITLGVIMLLGRYGVMLPVLAAAGALAAKNTVPLSIGTLPTHTPMFTGLLVGVIIIIGALNYVPALALGPMVEHVHMRAAVRP